jgi:hypothetical protein
MGIFRRKKPTINIEEEKEKALNKTLQWMKEEYNKALKKIAKTPIEFQDSLQKGITTYIETKEGIRIFSAVNIESNTEYVKQPKELSPIFTTFCFCGAFAEKPVPSSMFVKNVRIGLLKQPFFLPFTATPKFSAKKIYKEKTNWNPFIERLNQDKKLRDLIKKLPTQTSVLVEVQKDIYGNVKRTFSRSYKLNDRDDNYETVCQVIPFGDKTIVATRHMMGKGYRPIEQAVKTIIRIREHIIDYGYDQPTTGPIAQPWAAQIITPLLRNKK